MVRSLFVVAILVAAPAVLAAQDLESVSAEQARRISQALLELVGKAEPLAIKIEADVAKVNGVHVPDKLGLLVIPQKDLAESEELAAQFKTESGAPLAYLFTYRVVPVIDGKLVGADRLRTVKVSDSRGEEHTAFVFALTARQLADDDYRLWVYGAGNKPLVDVPFSEGKTTGSAPVVVEIKRPDEAQMQGDVAITVFGKYQATFRAGYRED